jgi:hypothetical protein
MASAEASPSATETTEAVSPSRSLGLDYCSGATQLPIVSCHVCGQKLRVPDGKRGTVACRCGVEWFHPETVELSDVEFRCSMSGARFNVISSRRSPHHKFVIQQIKKAACAAPAAAVSPQHASLVPIDPLSHLAPRKIGHWLASIIGRDRAVQPSRPSDPVSMTETSSVMVQTAARDPNEYNWNGFSCPYCAASSFVACAGGHLACDGRVELRGARRFHQCYCGAAGFIVGTVKAITARRLSLEAQGSSLTPAGTGRGRLSGRAADTAILRLTKGGPVSKRDE